MLRSEALCLILTVGELKVKDNFKKCYVRVRTKELRDENTNEVVRQSGTFDAEVLIKNDKAYQELKNIASVRDIDNFVPCTFMLRSFTYTEGGKEKLGKQLQLKRWAR